ncbi:MAG: secondary thiamine-phosphate synthase enzyme YjbQ [Candidatus Omnitrophota bacterium]
MIKTGYIPLETRGNTDVTNITGECEGIVSSSGISNGVLTVFCPGSTGGITTLEYEPNLVKDLREALEVFAPSDREYHHKKTWNDDNGAGHIRSSIVGPSLSVPIVAGKLVLGAWQQIVFCDFDAIHRKRKLTVQVMGE